MYMRSHWDLIEKLEGALQNELPGIEYQYRMAPLGRQPVFEKNGLTKAGVLLCLYPDENCVKTIFIKRPDYQGHHSGQISFPGGKKDDDDPGIIQTALREAKEEVGLHSVNIIGQLTPLLIPVSGFKVYPVVGYVDEIPTLIRQPKEVEYIIKVSLDELFTRNNRKWKNMVIREEKRKIPCYEVNNVLIWGATAMILSEFQEVLGRLGFN